MHEEWDEDRVSAHAAKVACGARVCFPQREEGGEKERKVAGIAWHSLANERVRERVQTQCYCPGHY